MYERTCTVCGADATGKSWAGWTCSYGCALEYVRRNKEKREV